MPGGEAAVLDHLLAARQHDLGLAAVERVELREQLHLPVGELGEVATAGWRSRHQALELGRAPAARASGATHGKPASMVAGVSSTPGIISSAHARVDGKAAFRLSSAGCAASSTSGQLAHRLAEVALLGGERADRRVEVGDQVLQLPLAAGERRR